MSEPNLTDGVIPSLRIKELKEALAYEARVVEAHTLDLASLSQTRRRQLEAAIDRMRRTALGEWPYNDRYGARAEATRGELRKLERERP